mmetsp:Transcript_38957/g.44539  ORF Transcript_38957/g.44539 Transcript_38957/m.44539 type:complete len:99 (-) Transcript_38957:148-444(-)
MKKSLMIVMILVFKDNDRNIIPLSDEEIIDDSNDTSMGTTATTTISSTTTTTSCVDACAGANVDAIAITTEVVLIVRLVLLILLPPLISAPDVSHLLS